MDTIDVNNIVVPNSGTRIFKDDCMFSFDTAFEPAGLDVCLTCHQAFSRGEFKHTQMHSEFCNHNVYLNIKKTEKKLCGDFEQPKKMIKLEVKESSEDDLFDTVFSVYLAKSDMTIAYPNAKLPLKVIDTIEGIIHATSSEKKNEIKAWEQEIKNCPHSTSITQSTISNFQLKQCNSCELTENLWICLHCGNLGCGRSQFGGVPGNSHAMAHQQGHHDHSVAVKLGSLSSDIADCYCYICDEEVKVPNLASLLKTYGINISNFIKTEKSLTELQIEQNIQWDFKMTGDGDEKLKPVFGAGLTGFKNLGNSCYLASVVQVLFSLEEFQKAFFNPDGIPLDNILGNLKPYDDLETQLFKIGDGLLSGRYSIPDESTSNSIKYQRGLKPSGFKSLIGEGHVEFSTMQQQDAYEFWTYLIDQIEKKKLRGALDYLPIESLKFITENKIKCTNCISIRIKKEVTDSLSIPLSVKLLNSDAEGNKVYEKTSIQDSLAAWGTPESFEYTCKNCGCKVAITRQGFKTLPQYLVLNPQRIVLENWVPTKTPVPVKFEEELDLSNYISEGLVGDECELPEDDTEEASEEFKFNQDILNSCFEMGFSENRAKNAVYATKNVSSEAAVTWLFEHMDDPSIDEPFSVVPTSKNPADEVDLESLMNLTGMGFSETLGIKALVICKNNVESAVEWLFNHPDDDGVIETTAKDLIDAEKQLIRKLESVGVSNSKYELVAVICHKGTSIHSGHYVAFIKKIVEGVTKWVLFNDEKVVLAVASSIKEIETSGHMYIYKRK